jgi:uncharacterized protein
MTSQLINSPGIRFLLYAIVLGSIVTVTCTRSVQRFDLLANATDGTKSYTSAIKQIRVNKDLYGTTNRLLYYLDQGLLFQYGEAYDSSLQQLEMAEKIDDELYARSITNEAASLLTNDLLRPYRPRRYERILFHQFMAFDYIANNTFDDALVESRKMQLITDAYKSGDKIKEKYEDDGMANYLSSIIYEAQDERDNSLISLYKSVDAYQHSPCEIPATIEAMAYSRFLANDRAADIQSLNLPPPDSSATVTGVTMGESEIIFIGFAGKSPHLEETVFEGTYIVGGLIVGSYINPAGEKVQLVLPAPPLPEPPDESEKEKQNEKTSTGTTFHIKMAFPQPIPTPSKTAGFRVIVDESATEWASIELTNTEKLLAQEIEDNREITLARTAIRLVLRTIAAQNAKERMETSSAVANLLLNVGTDVLSDQLEKADTRLCFLFPRAIHIIRIPVAPGTHRIMARAIGNDSTVITDRKWNEINVKEGEKKFLFFSSLR